MSMDLAKKTFSTTPEHFIAGVTVPIATAVKEAAETFPARTPVALNSDGKLVAVVTSEDGSNLEKIYGIVPESAEAGEEAVVYLSGEFFADSLACGENAAVADMEIALRNIGIFLK